MTLAGGQAAEADVVEAAGTEASAIHLREASRAVGLVQEVGGRAARLQELLVGSKAARGKVGGAASRAVQRKRAVSQVDRLVEDGADRRAVRHPRADRAA